VFHCTHSNGICHTGLLTACEQDQDDGFIIRIYHDARSQERQNKSVSQSVSHGRAQYVNHFDTVPFLRYVDFNSLYRHHYHSVELNETPCLQEDKKLMFNEADDTLMVS